MNAKSDLHAHRRERESRCTQECNNHEENKRDDAAGASTRHHQLTKTQPAAPQKNQAPHPQRIPHVKGDPTACTRDHEAAGPGERDAHTHATHARKPHARNRETPAHPKQRITLQHRRSHQREENTKDNRPPRRPPQTSERTQGAGQSFRTTRYRCQPKLTAESAGRNTASPEHLRARVAECENAATVNRLLARSTLTGQGGRARPRRTAAQEYQHPARRA